jgi:Sec-independent protein translocase protein TatA
MPGFSELVVLILVILLIFATSKLLQIANLVGRAVLNLRSKAKIDEENNEEDGDGEDEAD